MRNTISFRIIGWAGIAAMLGLAACSKPTPSSAPAPDPSSDSVPQSDARGPFYFDFQVTSVVGVGPGSRGPRYPAVMRDAGIEGRVTAQFVVDTTGLIELDSFRIAGTTTTAILASEQAAREFEQAVRDALPTLRSGRPNSGA